MQIRDINQLLVNLEREISSGKSDPLRASQKLEKVEKLVQKLFVDDGRVSPAGYKVLRKIRSLQEMNISPRGKKELGRIEADIGKIAMAASVIQRNVWRHQTRQKIILPSHIRSGMESSFRGEFSNEFIRKLAAHISVNVNYALASNSSGIYREAGLWISKKGGAIPGLAVNSPLSLHIRYHEAGHGLPAHVIVKVVYTGTEAAVGEGGVKHVKKSKSFKVPLMLQDGKRTVVAQDEVVARARSRDKVKVAKRGIMMQKKMAHLLPDVHIAKAPEILRESDEQLEIGQEYYCDDLSAACDRPLAVPIDAGKKQKKELSFSNQVAILKDMSVALREMHRLGYVHRDFKPANVFLKYNGESKEFEGYLADFDLCGKEKMTFEGTRVFNDILSWHGYSTVFSDVYAMAMTVSMLFLGDSFRQQMFNPLLLDLNPKKVDFFFREAQMGQLLQCLYDNDFDEIAEEIETDLKKTEFDFKKQGREAEGALVKSYLTALKTFGELRKKHPDSKALQNLNDRLHVYDAAHNLVKRVVDDNVRLAKNFHLKMDMSPILDAGAQKEAKELVHGELTGMEELAKILGRMTSLAKNLDTA